MLYYYDFNAFCPETKGKMDGQVYAKKAISKTEGHP